MSSAAAEKVTGAVPANLAGWRACAAGLCAKQAEQAAERTDLATRRQMLALAAATGDSRAQKRIEQLAMREQALDISAANVAQALERAEREITAAEAALIAEDRVAALELHAQRLTARLALVAAIEQRLQELTPLLASLGIATRDLTQSHLALGGASASLPPLATEAVGGRLAEFMTGIGFADWLPLARPEIRPALASWLEAETTAQGNYIVAG